jgi:hypothetical protein
MIEYFSEFVKCQNCSHEQDVKFISDEYIIEPIVGQYCGQCGEEFADYYDADEFQDY